MTEATPSPVSNTTDALERMRQMAEDAGAPVTATPPADAPADAEEEAAAAPAAKVTKSKKDKRPASQGAAKEPVKGTVRFVSKDPGLFVLLGGEGRDVKFDRGVAEVSPEVAALLEKNHLYIHDHISRADEIVRVNGKVISFKGDPGFRDQIAKAAADGLTIFYIDAPRGTRIPLGDITVSFSNGRALVDKKTAERLRRHRFFIEGRLTEITAD